VPLTRATDICLEGELARRARQGTSALSKHPVLTLDEIIRRSPGVRCVARTTGYFLASPPGP